MAKNLSLYHFMESSQKEMSPVGRFFRYLDWKLCLDVLILCSVGFLVIISSTFHKGGSELLIGKQFVAFLIGLGFLFFFALINYQIFDQQSPVLLSVSLLLLVLVLVLGQVSRGSRSWFNLGILSFQPAELCKVLSILVLASWCSKRDRSMEDIKNLMVPFAIVLAHVFLILLQPDFGSTLVYFPILLGILFVAGVPMVYLSALLFFGLMTALVVLSQTLLSLSPFSPGEGSMGYFFYKSMSFGSEFIWVQLGGGILIWVLAYLLRGLKFRIPIVYFLVAHVLFVLAWSTGTAFVQAMKGYQQRRLLVFFNPELDPMGAGYHVIQSVIALGSGKIFGKGLFSGTQGRLGFLPEQHTDFIYSVLGEELGFLGSAVVLLLFLLLIWRCFAIAVEARDRFGSLVAVGIGMSFSFYAILNLAMSMGCAPVTGLPLPFISYGGSSLISSLISVGILLSICVRRFTY